MKHQRSANSARKPSPPGRKDLSTRSFRVAATAGPVRAQRSFAEGVLCTAWAGALDAHVLAQTRASPDRRSVSILRRSAAASAAAAPARGSDPGVVIGLPMGVRLELPQGRFCRKNRLEPSMSRRGNGWDNAAAESFFASLKKERIKKRIYNTRDMAAIAVSDYIESFYNPRRRHSHIGGVSPDDFETAAKGR